MGIMGEVNTERLAAHGPSCQLGHSGKMFTNIHTATHACLPLKSTPPHKHNDLFPPKSNYAHNSLYRLERWERCAWCPSDVPRVGGSSQAGCWDAQSTGSPVRINTLMEPAESG
jgi:hypothetical protein